MRTALKAIIALCAIGVLWGVWDTLFQSNKKQTSQLKTVLEMKIYSTPSAPSEQNTNAKPGPAGKEAGEKSYETEISESGSDAGRDISFNDTDSSSAESKAAAPQTLALSNKKEDKRKYFSEEEEKEQIIAFENEYRSRKMTKDELFSELMDAVYFDDIPKVTALIKRGAPINSPEKNTSFTPVFMAISNGNAMMLRQLIEKGAALNIYDDKGYTPIHRAVTAENYTSSEPYPADDIIQVLLEYGTDINQGTLKEGATPLMIAAREYKPDVLTFLLDSGANQELTDINNHTALDYAKAYGCTYCIRILLE